MRLLLLLTLALLSACGQDAQKAGVQLELLHYTDLEGWAQADASSALRAFRRSCGKIAKLPSDTPMGPEGIAGEAAAWQAVCEASSATLSAVEFFELNFAPMRVVMDGGTEGLFTGYYEPLLFGSREKTAAFTTPIRQNPSDMITADLGLFHDDLKGRRVTGRLAGAKLMPYPDRAGIDAGAIDEVAPALLYVDDEIAKFFMQIQGSGMVQLPDGETLRVGYAGQNGHSYRAIGRDLIEMGELTRENVSLQSIRQWLLDHPDQAQELMHKNASYVFFRELTELNHASGPLGSHNVPLEPRHSLAVDRSFWPMGMPVWLDLEVPFQDGPRRFRELLIAQDTGGAIKGAIRGDVFWGAGAEAEHAAGHMKARGSMIVLMPRSIKPSI